MGHGAMSMTVNVIRSTPVTQVQQHDVTDRRAAQSAYQSHADRLALPPGSAMLSIEDVQRAIDDRTRGRQPGFVQPGIPEASLPLLHVAHHVTCCLYIIYDLCMCRRLHMMLQRCRRCICAGSPRLRLYDYMIYNIYI